MENRQIQNYTCPVFAAALRRQNDLADDATKPFLPRITEAGTAGGQELSKRRVWMITDWAVRHALPHVLDLDEQLMSHGDALRALPALQESTALDHAQKTLKAMQLPCFCSWRRYSSHPAAIHPERRAWLHTHMARLADRCAIAHDIVRLSLFKRLDENTSETRSYDLTALFGLSDMVSFCGRCVCPTAADPANFISEKVRLIDQSFFVLLGMLENTIGTNRVAADPDLQ